MTGPRRKFAVPRDMASGEASRTRTPYVRIREMILTNAIPPDTKLTIDKLARELGVSHTPVREALQRLEGDRLVYAKKPRGLWTTPLLDKRELCNLIEVRLLMEPWAAKEAATDRASNPGRLLHDEIDRFMAETETVTDDLIMAPHDTLFHDIILNSIGNNFLRNAYSQLHAHLHLYRIHAVDLHGDQTIEEHRAIADAICRQDSRDAEKAMRTHLLAALDRFGTGLDGLEEVHARTVFSSVLARPEERGRASR